MEPPRRKPSSPIIVEDRVLPGAVHELREIEPASERVTARPPAIPHDHKPPPLPVARPAQRIPTAIGMPVPQNAPPPMRPKLDSHEVAAETLLEELAETSKEKRAAQAEAEDLRRQLRELDHSNHLPRVEAAPVTTPPPKRTDWAKAVFGLLGALTLFLGGLGTYLGARAATKEQHVDVVEQKQAAQQVVVDPLPAKVVNVERGETSCKEWARAWDDYNRQVLGKLGVIIPPQPNAPPTKPIEAHTIVRRPNAVTGGPVLEVTTLPPPLP